MTVVQATSGVVVRILGAGAVVVVRIPGVEAVVEVVGIGIVESLVVADLS